MLFRCALRSKSGGDVKQMFLGICNWKVAASVCDSFPLIMFTTRNTTYYTLAIYDYAQWTDVKQER